MNDSIALTPIHTDIVVQSIEASIKFYTEVLGYSVVEDANLEGPVANFLSNGLSSKMRLVFLSRNKRSTMVELIGFENSVNGFAESKQKMRNVSLSYLVEDLSKAIEYFKKKNLKPVSDIFKISLPALGQTQIVFFQDPDGYLIELVGAD